MDSSTGGNLSRSSCLALTGLGTLTAITESVIHLPENVRSQSAISAFVAKDNKTTTQKYLTIWDFQKSGYQSDEFKCKNRDIICLFRSVNERIDILQDAADDCLGIACAKKPAHRLNETILAV